MFALPARPLAPSIAMSLESAVPVLTCLVSVSVAILLAAIPWAYGIHGRLTTIETSLHAHLGHGDRLQNHEQRLARLEIQQERLRAE